MPASQQTLSLQTRIVSYASGATYDLGCIFFFVFDSLNIQNHPCLLDGSSGFGPLVTERAIPRPHVLEGHLGSFLSLPARNGTPGQEPQSSTPGPEPPVGYPTDLSEHVERDVLSKGFTQTGPVTEPRFRVLPVAVKRTHRSSVHLGTDLRLKPTLAFGRFLNGRAVCFKGVTSCTQVSALVPLTIKPPHFLRAPQVTLPALQLAMAGPVARRPPLRAVPHAAVCQTPVPCQSRRLCAWRILGNCLTFTRFFPNGSIKRGETGTIATEDGS